MRVRTFRRVVVTVRIALLDRVKTCGPPTQSLDRIAHRGVARDIILLSRETGRVGSPRDEFGAFVRSFVRSSVRAFERSRVTTAARSDSNRASGRVRDTTIDES